MPDLQADKGSQMCANFKTMQTINMPYQIILVTIVVIATARLHIFSGMPLMWLKEIPLAGYL